MTTLKAQPVQKTTDSQKFDFPEVVRISKNTFIVTSFKDTDIKYRVDALIGTCTCPINSLKGIQCKHIDLVSKLLKSTTIRREDEI